MSDFFWPNLSYGTVFRFKCDIEQNGEGADLYVRCREDIYNLDKKTSYGNCTELPVEAFQR